MEEEGGTMKYTQIFTSLFSLILLKLPLAFSHFSTEDFNSLKNHFSYTLPYVSLNRGRGWIIHYDRSASLSRWEKVVNRAVYGSAPSMLMVSEEGSGSAAAKEE